MKSFDFTFATEKEIAQEISHRAKEIRVNEIKLNQKDFAKKIGISYGKYQRFEQNADIKLKDFLLIVRYLNRIEEITNLLKSNDVMNLGIERTRNINNKRIRAGWVK